MTETDKDRKLRQELKRINWRKYLDYGMIEIKVRAGECKMIEIKRSYIDEDCNSDG